jgi:hypothetical protein
MPVAIRCQGVYVARENFLRRASTGTDPDFFAAYFQGLSPRSNGDRPRFFCCWDGDRPRSKGFKN